MSFYNLVPLAAFFFNIVLIVLVLRRRWTSFLHRVFSLFLLVLALWAFGIFGMRSSASLADAFVWEKVVIVIGPSASVLFFHFTLLLVRAKRVKGLLATAYAMSFAFVPLSVTGFVVSGMQLKPYGYAPILGPLFYPWILFIYFFLVMGVHNLVKTRKYLTAEERNRCAYVIAGAGCYIVTGVTDVLPVMGIPIYPLGMIGNIVFCLLATIAILKYHLLDIYVAVRKGTAYFVMSAMVAIPYVGVIFLFTEVFGTQSVPIWVYLTLLIILALALQPLWSQVQRRVDRWFYRERYDCLKALENFARHTQSLADSAGLGSTMISLFAGALRLSSVYLLQLLPLRGDFEVISSAGMNSTTANIQLNGSSPLVKWLKRSGGLLSYQDFDVIPQLQSVSTKEKEVLKQISTELVVPLKTRTGPLSGLLILGPKLSEQPYTIEDKQLIYALSSQMAINLENAQLYSASQREVAERRRAEEAQRKAQERFYGIYNSSKDAIGFAALDGTLLDVNNSFCRLTGYSREELAATIKYQDITPKNYHQFEAKIVEGILGTGKAAEYEKEYIRKDGSLVPISVTSFVVRGDNGEPIGVAAIIKDITGRKQAEEREMELQQELYFSSRLAAIGELAAGVAHELNNPLTGILGFSEHLLRQSSDERVAKDLERIRTEALRAAKVVANLLTFARRREPKKEYADVNDIVQGALELRAYELKTGNIETTLDLTPTLPKTMVDFHQLQEVFLNIILNAEQVMTEANRKGKLHIKTQLAKQHIRVLFADDGPGIPAEDLDKVFDPFFTTRAERGGTGLGLSLCHGIIADHGGKSYVRSKPGKGATFIVELPVTTEKTSEDTTVKRESMNGGK